VDGGADPALARVVYTPFLADAVALLQHTHHEGPPLTAPISVFGGDDDPIVAPELFEEWAGYTAAGTHVHLHPGRRSLAAVGGRRSSGFVTPQCWNARSRPA
jgi:surfactin synthase thioesterase subunit